MFCSIYFENLSASIRFLNANKNIYYNRVTGQKYCIFLKKYLIYFGSLFIKR